MGDPVRPEEDTALCNLTNTFGESIWENVVIALTFANEIQPADPDEDDADRKTKKLLCTHVFCIFELRLKGLKH